MCFGVFDADAGLQKAGHCRQLSLVFDTGTQATVCADLVRQTVLFQLQNNSNGTTQYSSNITVQHDS